MIAWLVIFALVALGGLGIFWAWSIADAASFGDEGQDE